MSRSGSQEISYSKPELVIRMGIIRKDNGDEKKGCRDVC